MLSYTRKYKKLYLYKIFYPNKRNVNRDDSCLFGDVLCDWHSFAKVWRVAVLITADASLWNIKTDLESFCFFEMKTS